MKMVFDCFNESLDAMRPYGLRGKPLLWKVNPLKISSLVINQENVYNILYLGMNRMLKWGTFLCGIIPEKNEEPEKIQKVRD
jgi:hypothetical protein